MEKPKQPVGMYQSANEWLDLLMVRCADKREGWLFPSPRAKGGHLTTVAKQFREARRKAGLPGGPGAVLRPSYLWYGGVWRNRKSRDGENVMGHTDVRTAMRYQHPVLDSVREAIDQRNLHHKRRRNELRVQ